MKTNRVFTVLRLMVLGVLVAGFNAKPASAQVFRGKFTLPSATRWSWATLPAGDYSFTLDHDYTSSEVKVFRGTQFVARIQTVSMDPIPSGRSEILVESGAVRRVRLPQIGVVLDYPAPHTGHRAAPRERQLAQVIPVGAAGVGR